MSYPARSFWYVATPYSRYPGGYEAAFRAAAAEVGQLINAGIVAFSSIVHCHPLVTYGGVDGTDFGSWERYDKVMIGLSQGLIVCKLMGLEASRGTYAEIGLAAELGKPIVYMEPGVVPVELLEEGGRR